MNRVARLTLDTRGHDRLPAVRGHNDIPGLDVRRGVLQFAGVVAGRVVEAVVVSMIAAAGCSETPPTPDELRRDRATYLRVGSSVVAGGDRIG